MVSSIGSTAGSIFQYYQNMQSSSETVSTGQSQSFDELVSNGKVGSGESESGTGVTAMGGAESSESSSSSSNSEMDLNHDGQVTSDEVIKYMQMQMLEQMSEQTSSEDGASLMSQQALAQTNSGIDDFKNQQAAKAYSSGSKLMSQVTDMISMSFLA